MNYFFFFDIVSHFPKAEISSCSFDRFPDTMPLYIRFARGSIWQIEGFVASYFSSGSSRCCVHLHLCILPSRSLTFYGRNMERSHEQLVLISKSCFLLLTPCSPFLCNSALFILAFPQFFKLVNRFPFPSIYPFSVYLLARNDTPMLDMFD